MASLQLTSAGKKFVAGVILSLAPPQIGYRSASLSSMVAYFKYRVETM